MDKVLTITLDPITNQIKITTINTAATDKAIMIIIKVVVEISTVVITTVIKAQAINMTTIKIIILDMIITTTMTNRKDTTTTAIHRNTEMMAVTIIKMITIMVTRAMIITLAAMKSRQQPWGPLKISQVLISNRLLAIRANRSHSAISSVSNGLSR